VTGEDDLNNGYLDTPIDWITGMKNMRLKDLPSFLRTTDPNDIIFNYLKDECQAAKRATAIIINTCHDLEDAVIDAMSSILPPIYTIGPLTLLYHQILDSSLKAIGSNNLWKEDASCLKWLERKAPGSVIYVNFGSFTVMTNQQLMEFAWGLSNSGYDFLWVIRPDIVMGGSATLPKEFLDETSERGLLTTWCPQEEVLMHPSVGGFLTHCGWNSMMESISAGVPMICWPYFADQQTNCRYACSEWGIGMEINNDVKREEVESLIKEMMEGEKGKGMRGEVLRWKEVTLKAAKPGGKSYKNLDIVVKEVLLGRNA